MELITGLTLISVLGIGIIIVLLSDLKRAKSGKKSIFWEEDNE